MYILSSPFWKDLMFLKRACTDQQNILWYFKFGKAYLGTPVQRKISKSFYNTKKRKWPPNFLYSTITLDVGISNVYTKNLVTIERSFIIIKFMNMN